ncbi:hypothetical protein CH373_14130 [Leptospira perolatii]|uniref:Mop domain-containing protein n=2 Tax=Leptospira perolatii TaxID=2023191 RepID=A0A2M9ZKF1_9LEPT|nr:hypothetical protein CH360_11695 [Leptospira perolatii]PJZ72542.1 hypothetical protein CH373_14130 [Leptospira perolatii]
MKTIERNQFYGKVKRIQKGAVNSAISILLKGDQEIVATITNQSVINLGLKSGSDVYALIKASFALLSTDLEQSISSENRLIGKVSSISKGAVNDEIVVEVNGGNKLTSIITSEARKDLNLIVGNDVCAFFNASSVILALD